MDVSSQIGCRGAAAFFAVICVVLPGEPADSAEPLPTQPQIAFPVEGAIRGTELVLKSPATILIGEIHGTWEIPLLVANLVRSACSEMAPTILCLEIPLREQHRLDEFLRSDGGEAAVAALIAGPYWSSRDGLASTGCLALLELMRQLNTQGHNVRVVAIDVEMRELFGSSLEDATAAAILEIARKRDIAMARAILAARKEWHESNLIVLVGNVHARAQKGAPWDAEYVPMGWHVSQQIPNLVSLNVAISGGQAWVTTEKGTGPVKLSGPDRGDAPFIDLFDAPVKGYNGVFYVGRVSAAPPVRDAAK